MPVKVDAYWFNYMRDPLASFRMRIDFYWTGNKLNRPTFVSHYIYDTKRQQDQEQQQSEHL